jgi:hypothetical protein
MRRIMQLDAEAARGDPSVILDLPALLRQRLADAAALRHRLQLPNPSVTDVFRRAHSRFVGRLLGC